MILEYFERIQPNDIRERNSDTKVQISRMVFDESREELGFTRWMFELDWIQGLGKKYVARISGMKSEYKDPNFNIIYETKTGIRTIEFEDCNCGTFARSNLEVI